MHKLYDNYIISAIEELPKTQEEFLQLKKALSKKYKLPIPTNADMRDRYNQLVKSGKLKVSRKFEKILRTRSIRTQSGVAVVAVLTKPYPCPGKCLYCPTEKDMPKSYLSNEPAVMRAIDAKFNPYRQVQNRLRSLELNGHSTDKIELIVMGGTFSYLPKAYQKKFITECFRAANDYPHCHPERSSASNDAEQSEGSRKNIASCKSMGFFANAQNDKLSKEQKRNEKAKHRIIGLTLETRPDYINGKEILNFRNLGCTRVELGVQSIFDDVLQLNRRGHDVESTIVATKMLKDAGFKINYHMMPGLPGSTPGRDFAMFKDLFTGPDFQPDMLKIYPTVVLKDSDLYGQWKKKKYKPLSDKQFEKLVLKIKDEAIVPYVRIARLVRDVPTNSIIDGPIVSNLRQIIVPHSNCPCIRCREVKGDYVTEEEIVLDRIDYNASDGKEIFLQYVSPDPPRARLDSIESKRVDKQSPRVKTGKKKLFALLRLRIPFPLCHPERSEDTTVSSEVEGSASGKARFLDYAINHDMINGSARNDKLYSSIPILKNSAIIREVHTYGKLAKIDTKDKSSPQHIGLGKKLLKEAERIAKEEFGLEKIVVISGVGVRGYYRKSGYRLQDTYMVKSL